MKNEMLQTYYPYGYLNSSIASPHSIWRGRFYIQDNAGNVYWVSEEIYKRCEYLYWERKSKEEADKQL